jgi:hypothetical protein
MLNTNYKRILVCTFDVRLQSVLCLTKRFEFKNIRLNKNL